MVRGGETALMAAAYHGREEICRALLSRGADPRKQDKRGHDAAALARVKGNATLATLLDGVCLEPVAAPPRAATPPPPEAPATAVCVILVLLLLLFHVVVVVSCCCCC